MDTTITFTVRELLTWVLLLAAIVAVVVLIVVLAKLAESMKSLTKTLDNANTLMLDLDSVVKDAKDITYDAKRTVRRASHSVNGFCKIVDTNKGSIRAISNLANASASLLSIFGIGGKR